MPVAQMTTTDAVAAVRAATAHDVDQQVTNVQILAELDREYRRVRRWLSTFLPELFATEYLPPALVGATGGATIAKPVDYERVIRLERQFPMNSWYPLAMRSIKNQKTGIAIDVSGQYRLTYVKRPVDGYTTFDVPDGCEDLIILPVCAWVRARHDEDPTYHLQRYADIKKSTIADLSMRYGSHQRTALQMTPFWGPQTSFYESGSNFVIF